MTDRFCARAARVMLRSMTRKTGLCHINDRKFPDPSLSGDSDLPAHCKLIALAHDYCLSVRSLISGFLVFT